LPVARTVTMEQVDCSSSARAAAIGVCAFMEVYYFTGWCSK
jgi:hypothetical protein